MRFFAILTALPLATAAIVRRGGNNGGWGGGGNGGGGGGTDCRSTVTDTVWVSETSTAYTSTETFHQKVVAPCRTDTATWTATINTWAPRTVTDSLTSTISPKAVTTTVTKTETISNCQFNHKRAPRPHPYAAPEAAPDSMTNAERLRRGLPLKKPAVRSVFVTRAKDDQDKDNKDDKHKHDKNNGGKGGNRHGAVHHGFFDDGRGGHGGGASCSITTITETKTKTETHEACKSSTVTDFVCRYADQTETTKLTNTRALSGSSVRVAGTATVTITGSPTTITETTTQTISACK